MTDSIVNDQDWITIPDRGLCLIKLDHFYKWIQEIITVSQFVLARILNNEKHWHCFYQTRRGLLGNEPGEYGSKSHIHYISDSFGLSLEDVIKGFKAGICPHSKVHITFDESK